MSAWTIRAINENGGVVKCGSAKIALMWRKL